MEMLWNMYHIQSTFLKLSDYVYYLHKQIVLHEYLLLKIYYIPAIKVWIRYIILKQKVINSSIKNKKYWHAGVSH